MPARKGLNASSGSGACLKATGRDAVRTLPSSSKRDVEHDMGGDDSGIRKVPMVANNCGALSRIFARKSGQGAASEQPLLELTSSAPRFSEQ